MRKNVYIGAAIFFLLLCNGAFLNAQVTVGANKASETFSLLELISKGSKGLRLPQIKTTAQRDAMTDDAFKASPLSRGLEIFNMETKCVETWNGSVWITSCFDICKVSVSLSAPYYNVTIIATTIMIIMAH